MAFVSADESTEIFPYVAYVGEQNASITSGPGFQFYTTDRLPLGTRVEVYQHKKEWAAIRPPRGSFSWIPASRVSATANPDVVRVVKAGARARIGTRFSTKRDVESVRMRQGEMLQVLGQEKFTSAADSGLETWYKVAPPPGEFRWIRASLLETAPPKIPHATVQTASTQDSSSAPAWTSPSNIALTSFVEPIEEPENDTGASTIVLLSPDGGESAESADVETPKSDQIASVGVTTIVPIDANTLANSPVKAYDLKAARGNVDQKVQLVGHNDPPVDDRKSSVVQAQWSYDLAPRTGVDTFSPPAAGNPLQILPDGSPWREVNKFRNDSIRGLNGGVRQVAGEAPVPLRPPPKPPAAPQFQTANAAPATPLKKAGPVIPLSGPDRSKLWLTKQELMDVDLKLSEIVTQPPEIWTLSMLRARAQSVIDSCRVAAVRDEAQSILAKIARFEDVQRRARARGTTAIASATNFPAGPPPNGAVAGSWLDNVAPEYGLGPYDPYMDSPALAENYDGQYDQYADYGVGTLGAGTFDPYQSGVFDDGYDSSYVPEGYVPMPGERVVADRRLGDPAGPPGSYQGGPGYQGSSVASQRTPADSPTRRSASEPTLAAPRLEPPSGPSRPGPSRTIPSVARTNANTNTSNSPYDGEGWLMPVVTERNDMPRYVLTDSKGNVKQFVTPQAGLKLDRFLRKKIAIYGPERYSQDLQRPHLTAERVVSLDSRTR